MENKLKITARVRVDSDRLSSNINFRTTAKYAGLIEEICKKSGYKTSELMDMIVRYVIDNNLINVVNS